MTIDIAKLRSDTPACETLIHFNNAGAALMPNPVYQTLTDHLELERQIGGYEAAAKAATELDAFYSEFASLLNCEPSEIAYIENATRAWDMAFYALPLAEGDRIMTHASEYASNYIAFLQQAKRRGLHIDVIPSDNTGALDVGAMKRMITPKTRLVAITHAPSQNGLINPAAAVGKIAKDHGLYYLLDACQSVGQMKVDVQAIGCDILSGTGRKFLRGPRGTGFLYVSKTIIDDLDPPFLDLYAAIWNRDDGYEMVPGAKRFENWESYIAGRLGLMEAVKYARKVGLDNIETRVQTLANTLRQEIKKLPGISVHDDGLQQSAIVSFTRANSDADAIKAYLAAHKINVSTTPLVTARLDLGAKGIERIVRASLHYYNTEHEIERFMGVLSKFKG
jgi:selenocysteine lyase/cysteine desulfurase